jgi:hypothetical protein
MVRQLIIENGLDIGDVIIAHKRNWRIFNHFIVFLGERNGKMYFVANDINGGVREFDEDEVQNLISRFEPVSIRRLNGDYWQRQAALKRAKGQIGKKYDLLKFNCEHLATYIQYGKSESPQVQNWVTAAAFFGIILWIGGAFGGNTRR